MTENSELKKNLGMKGFFEKEKEWEDWVPNEMLTQKKSMLTFICIPSIGHSYIHNMHNEKKEKKKVIWKKGKKG